MKSKVELVTEATDDTNPITMCVVETPMLKEEKITILGYETVFREDEATNSIEIMIAVKGNIRTISMQIQHENRPNIMDADRQINKYKKQENTNNK